MIDDEDQIPSDDQPAPDPQEFREELEEGAQQDQEVMSDAPGVELPEQPESIGEMSEMGSDAAAEEQVDAPPPEIPPEEPVAEPAEPAEPEEPPPLGDLAEMGDDAAEEAQVDAPPPQLPDLRQTISEPVESPPPLADLEAMGADAAREQNVERIPDQAQQVDASIDQQRHEQFEFDVGAFEADMGGMDLLEAETSYRETNYAWQRLMTQMVIDHQHRLEQLLAMLERER